MKPAPFQILKFLPGTNCRDCGFETCLALATHLYAYGSAGLKKCPHIGEDLIKKVSEMFAQEGGGRAGTMIQLWEEFRKGLKDLNWSNIKSLQGFCSGEEAGSVCFNFLGERICVTAGDITAEKELLDEHTKILIYYYLKCASKLTGNFDFCDYRGFYSKLKVRDAKQEGFEIKVQNAVKNNLGALEKALKELGGADYDAYRDVYDIAVVVFVFPFVPVMILYRQGEEEFPPYCKFMFDKGCGICFDAEGLEHLSDYLAAKIIQKLK